MKQNTIPHPPRVAKENQNGATHKEVNLEFKKPHTHTTMFIHSCRTTSSARVIDASFTPFVFVRLCVCVYARVRTIICSTASSHMQHLHHSLATFPRIIHCVCLCECLWPNCYVTVDVMISNCAAAPTAYRLRLRMAFTARRKAIIIIRVPPLVYTIRQHHHHTITTIPVRSTSGHVFPL